MWRKIDRYLERRADLASRPLVNGDLRGVEQAVVIPVLNEGAYLWQCLASLRTNPPEELGRTMVICVVNNRAPGMADTEAIADNLATLERLGGMLEPESAGGLRLGYIDAASPGKELDEKGGVGMARKLGLDQALASLDRKRAMPGLLLCLDADTVVEPNYLAAVRDSLAARGGWATAVDYQHRLGGDPEEQAAILCYECFLRYHVLGLGYAGSPYAFPTIGSTMACRAEAYAAVSGMNRRQGGEDFYFLQQLAKTGGVGRTFATTVYPSSRPSPRVPFGTGRGVRQFLADSSAAYRLYHPEIYTILRGWLALVPAHLDATGAELVARAAERCEPLAVYLENAGFGEAWDRLRGQAPSEEQLLARFHQWFDGFRTLKLVHYLRDHGYPQQEMFGAVNTVLDWLGVPGERATPEALRASLDMQKALLGVMRSQERALYEAGR